MDLAANIQSIQDRIATACGRAGRDPASITLVAVSKGHPPELIAEAARCGLTLFGENKVQEAKAKIPLCSSRLRWHMIGHLQTNKCRDAAALFEMVQSVDSLHVAEELSRRAEQLSRTLPVLLEINVAGEASKFGYPADRMLADLLRLNQFPRLEIHGLMAIPPWAPNPEKARPMFKFLRELKVQAEQVLGAPLPQLSMGMSGDFEVAIEEGATLIRVGTAIFGERQKKT
jgi:pyridoxal phosphate enzyme (YggS family)